MGKDPDRIRAEIEETRAQLADDRPADAIRDEIRETRAQMGETVQALGQKADVKSRVRESVARKKDAVVGTVAGGKERVVGRADALVSSVTGAVPDTEQVKQGAAKVGVARESPLGIALAGAAFGFLVGLAVPSTRLEDEKIGETAEQVRDSFKETGQEALERGKQVAQEAVGSAKETASQGVREQGEGLTESLKDSAQGALPTGEKSTA
jgi:uncharacterized protein DUF3618